MTCNKPVGRWKNYQVGKNQDQRQSATEIQERANEPDTTSVPSSVRARSVRFFSHGSSLLSLP